LSNFSPKPQKPAQTVEHGYAKENEKPPNKIEPPSMFSLEFPMDFLDAFMGKTISNYNADLGILFNNFPSL